ncbi:hypothetical protein [Aestuariivirga sp.]|uniref:hypothetical protein n=1 Tax=Aestuariivirga sp. TaxID=2650926 RepID=UPI003918A41F
MQTTINPHRFVAQEISLSPLARGQSAVVLGGLRIGRVSHAVDGEGKSTWMWSLTGPHCNCGPADVQTCGETSTLAEAKLQLRHSFDRWLAWALEQEGPVHWHWTEAMPPAKPPAGKPKDHQGGKLALAG